jgi:hypothetical protein
MTHEETANDPRRRVRRFFHFSTYAAARKPP